MNKLLELKKLTAEDLKKIASKKIYFGHMSVGYNILDGLIAALPEHSGVNIIETTDLKKFQNPVFAHSKNGKNLKPSTKIAAFIQKMDSGLGNKVDIAFFKFCYVDVTTNTDVNKLFNEYKDAMAELIRKYPKTTFLHITVPVTLEDKSIKRKIKDMIKVILGKHVTDHVADNGARNKFNNLLKKEYKNSVFDLAAIESLTEDKNNNQDTNRQSLQKQYTDDGGHLNKIGSEIVATRLINFIINLQ